MCGLHAYGMYVILVERNVVRFDSTLRSGTGVVYQCITDMRVSPNLGNYLLDHATGW